MERNLRYRPVDGLGHSGRTESVRPIHHHPSQKRALVKEGERKEVPSPLLSSPLLGRPQLTRRPRYEKVYWVDCPVER